MTTIELEGIRAEVREALETRDSGPAVVLCIAACAKALLEEVDRLRAAAPPPKEVGTIVLPASVERRLERMEESTRARIHKSLRYADLHLHYTAGAVARNVVVDTLVLCEGQHGDKRTLAEGVATDDHRAHGAAHLLYDLYAHSEGGKAKIEGARAALAEVSPEAARLLGSHHMRSVSRGGKEDDHVAHAITRAALLKLREYEAAGAAGEDG
jgi:hypothetical protein